MSDDPFDSFLAPPPPKQASTVKDVVIFNKNGLQIHFKVEKAKGMYTCHVKYINTTPVPFTEFVFQLAVPKVRL